MGMDNDYMSPRDEPFHGETFYDKQARLLSEIEARMPGRNGGEYARLRREADAICPGWQEGWVHGVSGDPEPEHCGPCFLAGYRIGRRDLSVS